MMSCDINTVPTGSPSHHDGILEIVKVTYRISQNNVNLLALELFF